MVTVCPMSGKMVNEKAARMNAGIVFAVALIVVLTPAKWPVFILALDFFMRAMGLSLTPACILSKFILGGLKIPPKMVDQAPKVFAARIGFIITVVMSVLYVLGYTGPMAVLGYMLIIAAALEAFFGYCVGCKMYSIICRPK